ncbi:hypothetical protein L6164_004814 [Bauhinia variegata]|uniref:Uncharacterized protein n=1 Tax=Bauhinia variegata TaxID=167791 RepID=A0ACB9PNU8_BAUVA|nr:hypothetical protein L6164_004814 [Bauhinia variegata]
MRIPSSSSSSTSKATPCCSKVGIKRGPWTPEEDEILANFVQKEGEGRWRTLPKRAGLQRCGKSCRLRWMNYLRPSVKRGHIGPDEEDLILRLHRLLGNRWSLIAGRIPGRTDNEIKNYWNTHLSKKLISQGIDPRTHKPLINNDSIPNLQRRENSEPNKKSNIPHPISQASNYQTDAAIHQGSTGYQNITEGNHNSTGNDDVVVMGMGRVEVKHDINGGQEDTFSSFLDSLINDSGVDNQQLQDNVFAFTSPAQSFNPVFWESELDQMSNGYFRG